MIQPGEFQTYQAAPNILSYALRRLRHLGYFNSGFFPLFHSNSFVERIWRSNGPISPLSHLGPVGP
jgi:hypothetical protein